MANIFGNTFFKIKFKINKRLFLFKLATAISADNYYLPLLQTCIFLSFQRHNSDASQTRGRKREQSIPITDDFENRHFCFNSKLQWKIIAKLPIEQQSEKCCITNFNKFGLGWIKKMWSSNFKSLWVCHRSWGLFVPALSAHGVGWQEREGSIWDSLISRLLGAKNLKILGTPSLEGCQDLLGS